MPRRMIFMRLMLWLLALAAAAGALTALLQTGYQLDTVVYTCIAAAAACALLLPVSAIVDRENSRAAGLLGMTGVIVEFLAALILIWEAPRRLLGIRVDQQIAISMLYFGGAVVLMMVFLRALREPRYFTAGRFGIMVTGTAFAACMLGIWGPHPCSFGRHSHAYLHGFGESGWVTVLFGSLVVLCLIGTGKGARTQWRLIGIVGAAAAWTIWLVNIWIGSKTSLGFLVFTVSTGMAAVTGLANVLLLCSLNVGQTWVRSATIGSAILSSGFIDLLAYNSRFHVIGVGTDFLIRLAVAAVIVTGCGTLAVCVLARMNRKVDVDPVSGEMREVIVVCPRCRKKQPIPVGKAACSSCNLRISIRVEEPRCPTCDYLLYGLTSDRCPERGTRIGEELAGAVA